MYVVIGISFLLHIITILAVIVLYQRRTLERVNLPTMKEDVETLHHSMEAFIDEIEKENEHLYERMVQHVREKEEQQRRQYDTLTNKLTQSIEDLRREMGQEEAIIQENPVEQRGWPEQTEAAVQDLASSETEITEQEQEQEPPSALINGQGQAGAEQSSADAENRSETAEVLTPEKMEQIKSLYRQGFAVDHIAKVLHIGKGEAQLVVNLMKKN